MSQIPIYHFDGRNKSILGEAHGEQLRKAIHEMAAFRMEMMLEQTAFSKEEVLLLARKHLPILKNYDLGLYEELVGIGRGSGITLEELVVLNHYTDMRDLTPAILKAHKEWFGDVGCSVVFTKTPAGLLLSQTWDIHAPSQKHVCLFRIQHPADGIEESLVFSVAGCLGIAGMNSLGVGIAINNLSSLDAHIGLLWPALVRRVLGMLTAQRGKEQILEAPLGSGHHYAVGDAQTFFSIATSGTKKKVVHSGITTPYVHTNHCVDEEMANTHTIRPGSTTFERYNKLQALLAEGSLPTTLEEAFWMLKHVSISASLKEPKKPATCGALAMDLTNRKMMVCQGAVDAYCVPTFLETKQ